LFVIPEGNLRLRLLLFLPPSFRGGELAFAFAVILSETHRAEAKDPDALHITSTARTFPAPKPLCTHN
jgi:hypothetical protein